MRYGTLKSITRAKWMADFERTVTNHAPEHTGRIDWDSATYLFNANLTASGAAMQYINNRAYRPEE